MVESGLGNAGLDGILPGTSPSLSVTRNHHLHWTWENSGGHTHTAGLSGVSVPIPGPQLWNGQASQPQESPQSPPPPLTCWTRPQIHSSLSGRPRPMHEGGRVGALLLQPRFPCPSALPASGARGPVTPVPGGRHMRVSFPSRQFEDGIFVLPPQQISRKAELLPFSRGVAPPTWDTAAAAPAALGLAPPPWSSGAMWWTEGAGIHPPTPGTPWSCTGARRPAHSGGHAGSSSLPTSDVDG